MNVKSGTQTFSAAPQVSSLKGDGVQTMPATAELKKQFGDKSVGEIANQIADPNWVDPQKMRKVGNNSLDKDAFLRLMLAQMKNQDPSNPMQSHEMAAQLAQFTSLEQLFNINETLSGMKKGQDPTQNFQALNFIGKAVSGDTAKITRAAGDKEHELRFQLPAAAKEAKVTIKNSTGEVARSYTLANLSAGSQKISWNGLKDDGSSARPGDYSFEIEAKSTSGAKLAVQTSFEGRITGINYTKEGPVLLLGNQSVRLADVKKIVEAKPQSPAQQQPLAQAFPTTTVPPGSAKPENVIDTTKQDQMAEQKAKAHSLEQKAAPDSEELVASGNLQDVVMSGSLQDKINKELKGSEP